MSLIDVDVFAAYLGEASATSTMQSALDRAEALAASKIGCLSLKRRVVTERIDVEPDFVKLVEARHPAYYLKERVVFVKDGPVQEVQAFTFNNDNGATTDVLSTTRISEAGWAIYYELPLFTFDVTVNFTEYFVNTTYVAGWATEAELPELVRQFVLAEAATLYSIPIGGLVKIRLGDNYVDLDPGGLRAHAQELEEMISPYKRVRL